MLDVGFSEILLTSAIALIVLGPERLPKVARQVGNWMGRARVMARQLSEQLEREVSAEELLKTQSKPSPGSNLPSGGANSADHGAALDPASTPSIAPPAAAPATAIAPASAAASPEAAPFPEATASSEAAASPSGAPDPVHGLDAASTTAAAMHASDLPVADPHADPHAAATAAKPPHE
jgi:sec-independent protein translocase protein TatB